MEDAVKMKGLHMHYKAIMSRRRLAEGEGQLVSLELAATGDDLCKPSPPKRPRINLFQQSTPVVAKVLLMSYYWIIEAGGIAHLSSVMSYFNKDACERDGNFELSKANTDTQKYSLVIAPMEATAISPVEYILKIYSFLIKRDFSRRITYFCEGCEMKAEEDSDCHKIGCKAPIAAQLDRHGRPCHDSLTKARLFAACQVLESFYFPGGKCIDEKSCQLFLESIKYNDILKKELQFVPEWEFYMLKEN